VSEVQIDDPTVPADPDPDGTDRTGTDAGSPAADRPEVPEADLLGALEAVLLIVDAPVDEQALADAVGHPTARVRQELYTLADRYTHARSGIELREVPASGGNPTGWRLFTRDRYAPVVERFVLDGSQSRLSRAAQETLAVVAYRQPVSRARIAAVRGVNADGVIRTLAARGLIEEAGHDAETGAVQFRTTQLFLERLGLSSLEELPSLGPLLPEIDAMTDG
jgi:segregation and condensation protein B